MRCPSFYEWAATLIHTWSEWHSAAQQCVFCPASSLSFNKPVMRSGLNLHQLHDRRALLPSAGQDWNSLITKSPFLTLLAVICGLMRQYSGWILFSLYVWQAAAERKAKVSVSSSASSASSNASLPGAAPPEVPSAVTRSPRGNTCTHRYTKHKV